MSAELESEVISQPAPTVWISPPRFEVCEANHSLRNAGFAKGAKVDERRAMMLSSSGAGAAPQSPDRGLSRPFRKGMRGKTSGCGRDGVIGGVIG
ncbi:hypothetical protein V8J36_12635 [Frigidibacter sp. MR17.14]|uniref:hypothetical protein n=1 Tax=Frigidibacter sp. MR17.14 TaxID=3126509 RepID=UPI00301307BC